MELVSCEAKASKKSTKYFDCEVQASDGAGGGDLTIVAKLDETCSCAFAVFITEME